MRDFCTDFAAGRIAPLTFDRCANPEGEAPAVSGGILRLTVRSGAFPDATAGEPERCDRCEVREPGKLPLGLTVRHGFELRVAADFPSVPLRFVAAQLKRNGGGSPLFALRVSAGRLYADWRLPGLAIEHHDSLGPRARDWTFFELTSGPDGAALHVNGSCVTRLRGAPGPPDLTRYLKIGPYRDRHPAWGTGPATVEVRFVTRTVLA